MLGIQSLTEVGEYRHLSSCLCQGPERHLSKGGLSKGIQVISRGRGGWRVRRQGRGQASLGGNTVILWFHWYEIYQGKNMLSFTDLWFSLFYQEREVYQ